MRKGLLLAAVLALLAVVAVAAVLLNRSHPGQSAEPEASSQPAWVTQAVTSMRKAFVGNPEPISVRYHEGRKSSTITIRFSDSAICGGCSAPAGAALPRGRIATLSVDPRTHHTQGFSVGG